MVIDSNPTRGSQLAGFLISLGYDSELELSGAKGFLAAAESADVELILISFDLFQPDGGLTIPWPTSGPTRAPPLSRYSSTARSTCSTSGPTWIMITLESSSWSSPLTPTCSLRQLKGLPARLSEAERAGYAREAATLLARIATEQRKGPLTADLTAAEPALAVALNEAQTATAAATALGECLTPTPSAAWPTWCLTPHKHRQSANRAPPNLCAASGGSGV